jgi:dTDP-4-amino-4,6-dideoxygalactose transaminase
MTVPLLDVNAQNHPLRAELEGAFSRVLTTGRFIFGDEMEAFERECAAMIGVKHALSVSSGTDALILALMALDLQPGDEVLCPSFTFFATAGAIHRIGAVPVFCDVSVVDFSLCLKSAASKITSRTRCIMPVHLFGQCVAMDELLDFAKANNLLVLEDCAQAIGSSFAGKQAGTMGQVGAFSFFPSKNLGGFGDGGLVTTDDDNLVERMIRLRNHGMHPKYYHSEVGGNFRLDALQCALLRVKLPHYGRYMENRRDNARFYHEHLGCYDWLTMPQEMPYRLHTWNQFTLIVKNGQRDRFKQHLMDRGIGCEIYYPVPLHKQECFKGLPAHSLSDCVVAESLSQQVISIPIYPELSDEQKSAVIAAVKDFPRN